MKNYQLTIIAVLAILLVLPSCKEKLQEAKNLYNAAEGLKEAAENLGDNMEKAKEKSEERAARGDTVAMDYETLAGYLPESFDGYDKEGELKGNSVKMAGISYSTAEQTYVNSDGDKVKILLADYNGAQSMYMGVMALYGTYGAGIEINNNKESIKGFSLNDNIKGWEVNKKKTGQQSVFVGIADRFYATVEVENASEAGYAKEILADKIKTGDLEGM